MLHFIPYVGPALVFFSSGMAGLSQFGSLLAACGIAGLNAAVLFFALLFFGWLWGIWGLLLGTPLVAIAKVICDRVESLKPVGALLAK